jgi:sulfite reductase alpha subunit-like flavoprotein
VLSNSIVILYGSQGGVTASFARRLQSALLVDCAEVAVVQAMDRFSFNKLPEVQTLVVMSSTWESEDGRLMPANARAFWDNLCALSPTVLSSWLINTKLAVLGFGSSKYPRFCSFAEHLNEMLLRLGAHPFVSFTTIDVERADHGRKKFLAWTKTVTSALTNQSLPAPSMLIIPSVSSGGHVTALACPPGFHVGTITRVMEYKDLPAALGQFHYVEVNMGNLPVRLEPNQYCNILPCNPRAEVEALLNTIYPGLINMTITLVPIKGNSQTRSLPPHLTVRCLFENFVDLSRQPSRWFVQRLENQISETDGGPMKDIVSDQRAFNAWAKGKTYFTVLRQYAPKGVIPSIEVLVSMLPPMMPRSYMPLHIDPPIPHSVGICVRTVPNGLCSNFLTGLKKNDRVLVSFGTNPMPASAAYALGMAQKTTQAASPSDSKPA